MPKTEPYQVHLDWLNENPDKAVELLPELVRFLHWRSSMFVFYKNGNGKFYTTHCPRVFTTKTGREIK